MDADSAKRFAQDVNAQLTQTSALGAINAMMSEGDVAIGAAGSLPGDMQRMWRPTGVDTYNMEYGYSTMGYEVAGALGVKLAIGDKHEVYSFCGDGSFNMLHGELITACQEHKKINICLFDNAATVTAPTVRLCKRKSGWISAGLRSLTRLISMWYLLFLMN